MLQLVRVIGALSDLRNARLLSDVELVEAAGLIQRLYLPQHPSQSAAAENIAAVTIGHDVTAPTVAAQQNEAAKQWAAAAAKMAQSPPSLLACTPLEALRPHQQALEALQSASLLTASSNSSQVHSSCKQERLRNRQLECT